MSTSRSIEREVREGGDDGAAGADRALRRDRASARLAARSTRPSWPAALAGLDAEAARVAGARRARTSARSPRPSSTREPRVVELPAGPDGDGARGAGRRRRRLRAGRPRRLSLERADVRDPGPGCGGRAARPCLRRPAPTATVNPLVLAAAALCGVDEVYAMGGAQAIFALAYGTETIAPVDVIAGPGNAWVREAKRARLGDGRDRLARRALGADGGRRSRHRPRVGRPRPLRPGRARRGEPAGRRRGRGAGARRGRGGDRAGRGRAARRGRRAAGPGPGRPTPSDAIDLANAFAPEHLELFEEDAALLAERVTTAGCVFVGRYGATAFGDYAAGSNHVLPTGGAGRFSGPLGPASSVARSPPWRSPPRRRRSLPRTSTRIARAEGFPVHGESAMIRTKP